MDKDKFAEKVLDAEETMYRIAKSIMLDDSDCEDAVSEAVLKAYEKLHTLREERYFKTWLIRILINECYRKKRAQTKIIPLEEYADSLTVKDESQSELYGAVMRLGPKLRIVIVLHYIEGYSVEEVGKILKIPAGTVKSRLYSGRKQLKEELNDEEI